MKTNFEKVVDFCLCANHPVNASYQYDIFKNKVDRVDFRFKLINEEVNELDDAFNQNNNVEMVDALADILYVVYGCGAELGINLNLIEHNEDFIKIFTTLKECLDYIKKEKNDIFNYLNLMKISCENIKKKNFDDLKKMLITLIELCYAMANLMKVNLDEAFNLVHESNMTKFCNSESEAQETVEWYIKNEPRYKKPSYRKSNDNVHWVVYDAETDKALKSIKYKPVELKIFFES